MFGVIDGSMIIDLFNLSMRKITH